MEPLFLQRLYATDTPVVSVYLDTSREGDDPDRALELRWRSLRENLSAREADKETVEAVEAVVASDVEVAGRHGRAVIAAAGRILWNERLPEPPDRDLAHYGALPSALPLLLQRSPDIPYAVLVLHRVPATGGARPEDELDVDFELGRWPWSRVNSAAVHRRFPLLDWMGEAERIVGRLADEGETPELVVLAGDPWAATTLLRLVPDRLRDRFLRLHETGAHRTEPGRAVLEHELALLLADRLAEQDQRRLDAYLARPAHEHDAAGLARIVAVLRAGRAAALLINRPVPPLPQLWAGPAATDVALTAADLQAEGVGSYWEEDAAEALVRAAVGTDAEVIVVPVDQARFAEGLAVLLRPAGRPRQPYAEAGADRS